MKKRIISWLVLILTAGIFTIIFTNMNWWESGLHYLFPSLKEVVYPRATISTLIGEHLKLVLISSSLIILIGVPLGVLVTRDRGRDILPIVNNLTSIGQTFPPVAVLALAVPLFGFGPVPVVIALFLYGLLPVVRNTIAGLNSVSTDILEAARGMGIGKIRILFIVEIPLAAGVIMAGIRISVIINIGTAMIGAVIGAGGLGSPIIAGLVHDNLAFILEGVIPAATLAILIDQVLLNIERLYSYKAR